MKQLKNLFHQRKYLIRLIYLKEEEVVVVVDRPLVVPEDQQDQQDQVLRPEEVYRIINLLNCHPWELALTLAKLCQNQAILKHHTVITGPLSQPLAILTNQSLPLLLPQLLTFTLTTPMVASMVTITLFTAPFF